MDSTDQEKTEGGEQRITAKAWFDNNGSNYDDALQSNLALAENETLFMWLSTMVGEDTTIFDAGCGTGLLLDYLDIKPENYLGWDISETMVNEARKKHPNHTFEVKDIHEQTKQKYDIVVSLFGVVNLVPNIRKGFYACKDKMKPQGGQTIIMPNGMRNPYARDDSIYNLLNTAKIAIQPCNFEIIKDLLRDMGIIGEVEIYPFNINVDRFSEQNVPKDALAYMLQLEMYCAGWEEEETGFYLVRIHA